MPRIVRKLISTANAPKLVAPYNQAVVANGMVYVSGCLGLNGETQQLVPGGVKEQAEVAFKHLAAILKDSGSSPYNIVKNTIFVKDLNDMDAINQVYKEAFCKNFSARSCVQVARLPLDALIEIESIAMVGDVFTDA